MQAVECGLPLVTLEGQFMRGRLASGILRHMGQPELVAIDATGYVELAVNLGSDSAYRQSIRQRMDEARDRLFGDTSTVRALEKFLTVRARPPQ
jgi:predicted O-linked N-acetylglucosamine transferase (SPINDLY family)